jgi:hypothetical protein
VIRLSAADSNETRKSPILNTKMVGGTEHYLNSRIELGSGVLDLIRTHCDRLERAAAAV